MAFHEAGGLQHRLELDFFRPLSVELGVERAKNPDD
jgi:hypothetical protein